MCSYNMDLFSIIVVVMGVCYVSKKIGPSLSHLHVHHSGILVIELGKECYCSGRVPVERNRNLDCVSLLDLEYIKEIYGYSDLYQFWGLKSSRSMKDGLVKLKKDGDMLDLASRVWDDDKVIVFFEHVVAINQSRNDGGQSLGVKNVVVNEPTCNEEEETQESSEANVHYEGYTNEEDDNEFDDNFSEPNFEEVKEKKEMQSNTLMGLRKVGNPKMTQIMKFRWKIMLKRLRQKLRSS